VKDTEAHLKDPGALSKEPWVLEKDSGAPIKDPGAPFEGSPSHGPVFKGLYVRTRGLSGPSVCQERRKMEWVYLT